MYPLRRRMSRCGSAAKAGKGGRLNRAVLGNYQTQGGYPDVDKLTEQTACPTDAKARETERRKAQKASGKAHVVMKRDMHVRRGIQYRVRQAMGSHVVWPTPRSRYAPSQSVSVAELV